MKKIDLHIHTVVNDEKDAHFEFDVTKFQEYVDQLSIDAVAITNHNLFNIDQFKQIRDTLNGVAVFPGIEIDFEGGHLLLISGGDNLDDFDKKCGIINSDLQSAEHISIPRLKEIFVDLSAYLLIPHYDKKPKVKQEIIDALVEHIYAGEVQSPKKFNRIIKESGSLTPVLFSDARISANLEIGRYQGKQTFIKTNADHLSIDIIKATLKDGNKIFLNNEGKQGFFQVFSDGQELSNGLNVVIGGRSSGKTFFLNRLEHIFNVDGKYVKYIKQFDLVKQDEKKFNKTVERERSAAREKYLQEFKAVVEDATKIDRRATNYKLNKYLSSLLEFASNEKLHDEFSNATLFTEIPFQIRYDRDLVELLQATKLLLENKTYADTISAYLSEEQLSNLLADLERQYRGKTEENLKKEWVNELVLSIGNQLKHKSSSPHIQFNDSDFYDLKIEREKIKRFNAIARAVKRKKVIEENSSFGKFNIQAIAREFRGAGELKDESGKQIAFSPVFKKYQRVISYLEGLKNMDQLDKSELYKYFTRITYQVLNEFNRKVSGGERAEFNLLKALQDARQYEMLLVDEPESSFDNLFLKDNVNQVIKEISQELPVVVVTHNNTVGMLLQPDYILYTKREVDGQVDHYFIFSGAPGERKFRTADGTYEISSYATLLDSLEAGESAYKTRGDLYKNYKS